MTPAPTFAEPAIISHHSDDSFNVLVQTANAHGIGVLVQEAITGNRAAAFLTLPQLRHMLTIAYATPSLPPQRTNPDVPLHRRQKSGLYLGPRIARL